ncbi:unnamed protein product, partial [Discosporangium mesarthrocarpum]
QFYCFTRWGRTGTAGSCKLEGPFDTMEVAGDLFAGKFREKTGNEWNVRNEDDRYVSRKGKYECLRPNKTAVTAELWQYWVDDGVDGKADGWYDYDKEACRIVEQLHTELGANPHLHQRVVASGT